MAEKQNLMRNIKVEKITLNIGTGREQSKLDKGIILLKSITGVAPLKTITNKRIQSWGLRPGLPIGCKVTLRKKKAEELLVRLLQAKDMLLDENNFDDNGNVSFGIHEYIDIPGVEYNPKLGVIGLQVCVTLERPGFRIKKRKNNRRKISPRHAITQEDSMMFMKEKYNVKIGEEE